MPVSHGAAAILLQDIDGLQHDLHLAMIFLALIAGALVLQAVGVLVAGAAAARMMMRTKKLVEVLEAKAVPALDRTTRILNQTEAMLADLTPRLRRISENTEQISATVRTRVEDVNVTVTEVNETLREMNGRTRAQMQRVDGMVSEALTTAEEISKTVQQGIKGPVKQMAGLIAGVQAAVRTLVERSPFRSRV
ncbi:MAG: hypothetical protein ACP5E5_08180 [Acidobacteriaceae bacterium]